MLVFLERHYLPPHQGRRSEKIAPSTLAALISGLRRALTSHGRVGPWLPAGPNGPVGNPADSQAVTDYQRLFAREAQLGGYHEVSAVPLSEAAFRALLSGLDQHLAGELQVQRSTGRYDWKALLPFSAAFTVLWHSCRRDQDVLYLTWENLYTDLDNNGTSAFTTWSQDAHGPTASKVYAVPTQNKTEQIVRPETWTFGLLLPHEASYCAIQRLHTLFRVSRQAGVGSCQSGPVFQSYSARGCGVLSASALAGRLTNALALAPPGSLTSVRNYTLHSFRRGRLQCEAARRVAIEQLMCLAVSKVWKWCSAI